MNRISPAILIKLLLTALFWGGAWIAGRIAVVEAPPLAVAAWRFFFAALGLFFFIRLSGERIPSLDRSQIWLIVKLGASGIFLYNICFLYGLKYIEAGRGALVVALTPAVIALFAWLRHREPMGLFKALGIALALGGCLVVIGNGDPLALLKGGTGIGEMFIIGCVVLWAAYTFIGKQVTNVMSPIVATFYACMSGLLMLIVAGIVEGSLLVVPHWSASVWLSVAFLGFVCTSMTFTWYADAVKQIGALRAGIFINLVPVSAVLLGALFLGEHPGIAVLVGGIATLLGVALTNYSANIKGWLFSFSRNSSSKGAMK